jgi:integral membrane protein
MISLKTLRLVALAEATSFLALLAATYFKYSDQGEVGVQVLGPIHGLLFLAYVVLVLALRPDTRWSTQTTFWILVAAVLPFGGYAFDWWLTRRWNGREPASELPG